MNGQKESNFRERVLSNMSLERFKDIHGNVVVAPLADSDGNVICDENGRQEVRFVAEDGIKGYISEYVDLTKDKDLEVLLVENQESTGAYLMICKAPKETRFKIELKLEL